MVCRKKLVFILLFVLGVFFFNEYLIYYFSFLGCSWPDEGKTKVMLIADTHLLGPNKGHWFDKLRREWQMHRAFQTAVNKLLPTHVFFLGDLFDEGQWGPDKQFEIYVQRFRSLFYVPNGINVHAIIGNHDAGFHYALRENNVNRFYKHFGGEGGVEYVDVDGSHFVLINSMAMEGDGCRLCDQAEKIVKKLSVTFNCSLHGNTDCAQKLKSPYSRPILLQHFPLFRSSDLECHESTPDLAPAHIREDQFRQRWDCLSNVSTHFLLRNLRPRAVFSGHVHYGCSKWWAAPFNFWEYTMSSFSWRNNPRPSFLLLSLSPTSLDVDHCFLPNENLVILIYALSTGAIAINLILSHVRKFHKYKNMDSRECLLPDYYSKKK